MNKALDIERPSTIVVRFNKQHKDILVWLLDQEGSETSPRAVPWSAKDFLGEEPTKSNASMLSRSLSFLSREGLITLEGNMSGKKRRTSHVLLTDQGRSFAKAQKQGTGYAFVKITSVPTGPKAAYRQMNMLKRSALLFNIELKRIDKALESDLEDYTQLKILFLNGKAAKSREEVTEIKTGLEDSLEVVRARYKEIAWSDLETIDYEGDVNS